MIIKTFPVVFSSLNSKAHTYQKSTYTKKHGMENKYGIYFNNHTNKSSHEVLIAQTKI